MSFIMQEQRAAQRHANSSMRHAGVTPGGNSQIALGDGSSMSESFRQAPARSLQSAGTPPSAMSSAAMRAHLEPRGRSQPASHDRPGYGGGAPAPQPHAGVTPGGNSQIALGDGSSMSESFRQSGGGGYGRPTEAPQMRGAEGYRPNYAAFAHGGLQSSSTELGGPQQVGRSSTRLHAPPGGSSQIVFG